MRGGEFVGEPVSAVVFRAEGLMVGLGQPEMKVELEMKILSEAYRQQ
jgi:hypothetical protein